MSDPQSIQQNLIAARVQLQQVDLPIQHAEWLLATVLKKPALFLHTDPEYTLSVNEQQEYKEQVQAYVVGKPLAYLLGEAPFLDFMLHVSPHTLIPRPETELLVELILQQCSADCALDVLELGTGTGAITIALARSRPNWRFVATDLSGEALAVAQSNIQACCSLEAQRAITLCQGDWFDAIDPQARFDVIVSNPPYISEHDPEISPSVREFEPKTALFAPENGQACLRQIIDGAKNHLKPGGFVLLEHGYRQAQWVQEQFSVKKYHKIKTFSDEQGHSRATLGFF